MTNVAKAEMYEVVIGLEVHAQLATETKIFCGCPTRFGAEPNTNVCPVCLGMPGVLPALNARVVEFAIRTALALGCELRPRSIWARKNYFYPDLPKGYQISQYDEPIAVNGKLEFVVGGDGGTPATRRTVRINRVHMEEDAGKSVHAAGRDASLVDYNRSGVPLLEIVTEPDLRSPEESAAYLRALRQVLRTLGVCDGNMEEGSMRADANVSLRPRGATKYGTRAEIKNMNSFRFVEQALHYEIARQAEILGEGGRVVQETRLFDSDARVTRSMRSKEQAHDYRYFPDPDLLPLVLDDAWVGRVRDAMPELPMARIDRYQRELGLPEYDARVLTAEREVSDWFEAAVAASGNAKSTANWVMSEVLREVKDDPARIVALPLTPVALGKLIRLIDDGTISGKIAKELFAELVVKGGDPAAMVAEKGLQQVSDRGLIEELAARIMAANPKQVESYRSGKLGVMGFFVGQVMKETKGQANPQLVNDVLKEKLGGPA